jgi:hypothetical protein
MRTEPQALREGGYAYLMALFMVLAVLIASQVAMQNLLTQGRREREAELVWRGQQFVRAIRLYYKKTGHYPQNLEQLKKGMPELNFLRYAAYKDPLKKDDDEDGGWRFIYVNAAGQIIGSVKYATLQQMAILDMNGGKLPGVKQGDQSDQPGVPVSSLADQSSSNGSSNQSNSNASNQTPPQSQTNSAGANAQGTTPPAGTAPFGTDNSSNTGGVGAQPQPNQNSTTPTPSNTPGTPAAIGGGLNTNLNNQSLAALAALKPTGPVSGPQLGAFLTGVASSVDKPSIRFYNGGKKYIQWEFIWNPVEDQAKAVQQGLNNPQAAAPGQPGQAIGAGAAGTSIFGNPAGAVVTGGPGGAGATGPNGSTGGATPQQNSSQFGQSPQ